MQQPAAAARRVRTATRVGSAAGAATLVLRSVVAATGSMCVAGLAAPSAFAQAAPPSASPAPLPAPAAAPAAAPATALLTLEQAIARSLQRHPAVVGAAAEREVADEGLRRAGRWANPTITVDSENVLGVGPYRSFDSAETTVSLTQEIPLGGKRSSDLRGARAGQEAAGLAVRIAELEVRRDVTIAYAAAVAADRLAAIARDRARVATETRSAAEQRFTAGVESELRRSSVEVAAARAQATARRASAESIARRRALAQSWRDETTEQPLDAAWFDAVAAEVDESAHAASPAELAQHPQVRAAQIEYRRAQAALDFERAQRVPNLEATIGTRRFAAAPGGEDHALVLGLSAPLPLWYRNGENIAAARARLTRAEIAAERAPQDLRAVQDAALAELDAARLELRTLTTTGLPAAENAARLARQAYDAGRLSLAERLDAEAALFEVREQVENIRLEVHRAHATLAYTAAGERGR
ncbi:MAG: TolC family protein [Steroidobacteraceae bacterium]